MIWQNNNRILYFILAFLMTILSPSLSMAKPVATLTFVRGEVDLLKPAEERARPVKKGDALNVGDIIRTKSRSRAQISFIDGSKVNMAQKSRVEIKEFSYNREKKERKSILRTFRGKLRALIPKFFLGDNSKFEIETPTAVAAVRGTDFFSIIKKLPLESEVLVVKGKVAVRNLDPAIVGEVLLKAGQSTKVGKGLRPLKPRLFTSKEIKRHMKETEPDEKGFIPREKPRMIIKPPLDDDLPTSAPVGVDVIVEFP